MALPPELSKKEKPAVYYAEYRCTWTDASGIEREIELDWMLNEYVRKKMRGEK